MPEGVEHGWMGAESQEENWPNTLRILEVQPTEGPDRVNLELASSMRSRFSVFSE